MMSYFRWEYSGLHLRDHPQQSTAVIGLREALAVHDPAALQLRVGVEEAVGGHQLHPRGGGPAAQHLLQHTGGGGLPDGDGSGHADHKGRAPGLLAQEVVGRGAQLGGALHVDGQQSGQRQVDLLHLVQGEVLADAAQAVDVVLVQRLFDGVGQSGPGLAVQLHEG